MALDLLLEFPHPVTTRRIAVSQEMLAAGRSAFSRNRAMLSDLYEYFPCDRDAFITGIYKAMARLAP